jgi:transcriptional regulator with XRE-family HTH domain
MLDYGLSGQHGGDYKHALSQHVKHAYRVSGDTRAMSLGERIKGRRKKLGVSVADLAAACSVSKAAVYQWESGDTKGLRPENLVLTADRLRTYTKWLVFGQGPEDRPTFRDELNPAEDGLIEHVRSIPTDQQAVVTALARSLYEQQFGNKAG